jgi:hypothetical protein
MSKYFNFFPKTLYTADSKNVDVVNNITSRFNFEESFKINQKVSYEYEIKDSDTPEIIASKFYGDPERHWIVLLFNNIIDPQFDWPMDYKTLISFIDEKYSASANVNQSGSSWAQSHTKAYYKIETRTIISTNTITVNKMEVDANTYNAYNVSVNSTNTITLPDSQSLKIEISKETQSYYDYEMELNESKRSIKLLKPEFVPNVEQEFRRVIA